MNEIQLPRYKCHKEVSALKIHLIQQTPADVLSVPPGGTWRLTPENTEYAPFDVPHSFYEKHRPTEGGYYVVYDDGYKSFSPAKAFEEGYTLVPGAPAESVPASVVTDEMVNRFLAWKLPDDFNPDGHIVLESSSHFLGATWPIGTNLFSARQARAMLEHILQPPAAARNDHLEAAALHITTANALTSEDFQAAQS